VQHPQSDRGLAGHFPGNARAFDSPDALEETPG
jgi:hypothetical protein